jgi:hypothetical protein
MAAKTHALLIRLTPEDRARIQQVAAQHYLEASTWARQVLLRAAAEAEHPPSSRRKTTPAEATRRRR